MKIHNKLFSFSAAIILSSFLIITTITSLNINHHVYQEKKLFLKHLIDNAISIISYYHSEFEKGKISKLEAKKKALSHINHIRYNDNNYFWIQNFDRIILIHPILPELNNTDSGIIRDPNGIIVTTNNGLPIVIDAIRLCKTFGSGYLKYSWPKFSNLKLYLPKLSYVKTFSKWNWIIGTGVYIDDIQQIVTRHIIRLILIFLAVILFALIINYLFARHFSRPLMTITKEAVEIANQNFQNHFPDIYRKDEIGVLYDTIKKMRQNIISMINELAETNQSLNSSNLKMKEAQNELFQKNASLEQAVHIAEITNIEKTQIIAIVSHELRAPLTGIKGFSDMLLRDTSLSETQLTFVERIKNSSEKLIFILNDLLEISVIESGKLAIHYSSFNLINVIQDIYETYKRDFEKKNLYFNFIPNNVSNIYSDPIRINQIFHNLIGNALKFTSQGGITIETKIEENQLIFSVADTGIGIADDDKAKVFEMFRQLKKQEKDAGGTGLGLAICKKILHVLKGDIEIQDNPCGGSKFIIHLPIIEETGIINQ